MSSTHLAPQQPNEAVARISVLEDQIHELESEIKTLEGQIKNRDEKLLPQLTVQIESAGVEYLKLKKQAYLLLIDSTLPRREEDLITYYELLRLEADLTTND